MSDTTPDQTTKMGRIRALRLTRHPGCPPSPTPNPTLTPALTHCARPWFSLPTKCENWMERQTASASWCNAKSSR